MMIFNDAEKAVDLFIKAHNRGLGNLASIVFEKAIQSISKKDLKKLYDLQMNKLDGIFNEINNFSGNSVLGIFKKKLMYANALLRAIDIIKKNRYDYKDRYDDKENKLSYIDEVGLYSIDDLFDELSDFASYYDRHSENKSKVELDEISNCSAFMKNLIANRIRGYNEKTEKQKLELFKGKKDNYQDIVSQYQNKLLKINKTIVNAKDDKTNYILQNILDTQKSYYEDMIAKYNGKYGLLTYVNNAEDIFFRERDTGVFLM